LRGGRPRQGAEVARRRAATERRRRRGTRAGAPPFSFPGDVPRSSMCDARHDNLRGALPVSLMGGQRSVRWTSRAMHPLRYRRSRINHGGLVKNGGKDPEGAETTGPGEVGLRESRQEVRQDGRSGPSADGADATAAAPAADSEETTQDAESDDVADISGNGRRNPLDADPSEAEMKSTDTENAPAGAAAAARADRPESIAPESVGAGASGDTRTMPASSPSSPSGREGPPGGRAGRGGAGGRGGRPRSRRSRFLHGTLFTMLDLFGFFDAAFAVAYLFTPVPSPLEKAVAQGPTFYYSDGKTEIAKTGVNRDAVDLDRIPESTRNAVIAAENGTFYEDPGVSVRGTVR